MQLDKKTLVELAEMVANAVVTALEKKNVVSGSGKSGKSDKSPYKKTEQLLYNYLGFKRIVQERMDEIEHIKKYGVPQKNGSVVAYTPNTGGTARGIVLPEESVENAVRSVEASVEGTVQAIALIDKCMAALKNDPYYRVLEMRYFDGRTLEDIGASFGCDHTTISRNKNRLVKELSMRLFPDEVIGEYMN
jgi:DNA-directed RNA polymerase specialized sigma subunit